MLWGLQVPSVWVAGGRRRLRPTSTLSPTVLRFRMVTENESAPFAPDRDRTAARLRDLLEAQGDNLAAAYLFGSVARGEATTASDVDVAVLHQSPPPATLDAVPAALEADLTRALGVRVQIVVLDRAPVDVVHRVLRDGVLVLERDRKRRIEFEVRARNVYWDLRPILQRYRYPRSSPK
jgi:predicted nucleotidyltransferase